ncbi:MAG: phosphate ABC transporter substrate-binding protein, partial [Sphingomonadales bacterium]
AKTPFGKPNKAKTWKDVNGSLPATPIRAFGPPPTSGTRDAFGELIMTVGCNANPAMVALKKSDEAKHKAICTAVREDGAYVETGENDNLIVQKLESNPGTIGIFGYSYLEENDKQIKGIAINGVAPTYDSIASFKYPGSRPLYIYVKNAHVRAIPAIKAFVAEFTKEAAWGKSGYLVKRGMIAAPDAIRAKSAAAARALTPLDPAEIK